MVETSSLRLRVDPEDWLDADLPTALPAEPDGAPFDLDLPVVRVAAWEAVEAGPDPADGQGKPAAPDRRPLPEGVPGWQPGDEVTI